MDARPNLDGYRARDARRSDQTVYYTAYGSPESEEDEESVRHDRRPDGSVFLRTPRPTGSQASRALHAGGSAGARSPVGQASRVGTTILGEDAGGTLSVSW